ncbi:MAG: PAS domain-containing protein [Actinobacteria bacterium]|nr:PAS domain-containing protein [Actinomycetota bacterium]
MSDGAGLPDHLVDTLMVGIWMIDRDGVTTFVNPYMTELLGVSPEAMLGRPLLEFFHPDDHQIVLRHLRKRRDGLSDSYDARLARPDDQLRHVRVQGSPVRHAGEFVGSVAAITDLTDVYQHAGERDEALQRAEESVLDKTRFLSWVSHELRTPLTTISGFAQLLEANLATGPDRDMAVSIHTASAHVDSLVQDLLDYAQADSDVLEPSLHAVSLRGVLDDALGLVAGTARDLDVRIDLHAGTEHVMADRRHLVQVVLNLLSNAVKYGGRGTTVCITTSVHGSVVHCSITDEGPGIPPELQRQAFRPFERLDNATGVAGVGLGLSIAESFMRAMKGNLTLTSPPGRGATFTIELPLAHPDDDTPCATDAVEDAVRLVLYVEDEPLNASLMESIVGLLPGRVLQVEPTVAGGIAAAVSLHPALVLLDLNLPDGSGLDVLQAIRADPATERTPVFILSADATEQAARRSLDLGADRFITKPFNLKEFVGLLDAAT